MGRHKSWRCRCWPALFFILVFPGAAQAHTVIPGANDFFNGVCHPLLTPAHLLILLGLGLWMGQRQPMDFKTPMLVFAPFSAVALLLTSTGMTATVYPPLLISIALGFGLLVVLEKPLSPWACRALFAAAAVGIGLDSVVEKGPPATVIKMLSGTWICLVLLVVDLAFYISFCTKRKWSRVGIRVMGSWITAVSMLVLAFFLRK